MRAIYFYLFRIGFLALAVSCTQTSPPSIQIDGVIYDGFELANGDEAIILHNAGTTPVDLGGWQLTDGDSGTAVLPPNILLNPRQTLWLTKNGTAFSRHYRHVVDYELEDTTPLINNLSGTWPGLTDTGDEIMLLDAAGRLIDIVVFKAGDATHAGWTGTAVQPAYVEEEGLFLTRTHQPDTDTAADWQHTTHYELDNRKIGSNIRIGANLTKVE